MAEQGGQHILQTALKAGMSATEGIHNKSQKSVDSSFDGTQHVLPQNFMPGNNTRVTFAAKDPSNAIQVPIMNWGAWSWGDKATWQWDESEMTAVEEAWKYAVSQDVAFIDTAQAYGSGESEVICGKLVKGMPRDKFQMQTKWYVVPDNMTNLLQPSKAPAKMLKESLERMQLDYIDSYLVHGPIHSSSYKQVAKGLAECVESGMTKTVGVANYDVDDIKKLSAALSEYGIPIATNQVEFHVLRRLPETSGLLKYCKDHNIVLQSYSSLAQGRLSGKYTPENPPPEERRFSSYPMEEIEGTLNVLRDIAKERGKPVSAVTLNYNMSKGVLPTVGMRNIEQVKQNLEAFGWRLTMEELKRLDDVSLEGKSTKLWQQG